MNGKDPVPDHVAGRQPGRAAPDEAVRRSEERFRSLVEATAAIVWTTPASGLFESEQPGWQAFTGQGFDECKGQGWLDCVHPDDREETLRAWSHALRTRGLYQVEHRLRRRDGSYRDMIVRAVPLVGDDGTVREWVGVHTDVTEAKHADEAVRRAEQRFRLLVQNSSDILTMFDAEGTVLYESPSVERVLGIRPEDRTGRNIFRDPITHPDDRAAKRDLFERALARPGVPVTGRFRLRHADGSYRDIEAVATNRLDDPAVAGVVANYRDTTERTQFEEALRLALDEAEATGRAKDQFLAVLSHELRNPLNPVLVGVSALLASPETPGWMRPTLEVARRNVALEARLIDDLLDVTRIRQGKLRLESQVVDVHVLVREAAEICRDEITSAGLRLSFDLSAPRHHVAGDPARLQQVLWNLIKNAAKFTPRGGAVHVRSRPGGGPKGAADLVVEVTDTGVGIAAEAMPRIFSAFEQADASVTKQFGGLGLGLTISRSLAEAHGGTLTASSPGPGLGSTFTLVLPAADAPAEGPHRADQGAGRDGPTPPQRILLVEDNPDSLRLLARLLAGRGHRVSAAGNVAQALAATGDGPFDLVISDIGLPDGSGFDVIRQAQARGPVKGIALSGYGREDDVRRAREAGFSAHLTKPIDFPRLEEEIRRVVGGPDPVGP